MLSSKARDVARRIVANRGGGNGLTSGRRLELPHHPDENLYGLDDISQQEKRSPTEGLLVSLVLNMAEFKDILPPSALMILVFLIAGENEQPISQKVIAGRTGYSQSSVERSLKLLREREYIDVHKEVDQITGITINRYEFEPLKDKLADLEDDD